MWDLKARPCIATENDGGECLFAQVYFLNGMFACYVCEWYQLVFAGRILAKTVNTGGVQEGCEYRRADHSWGKETFLCGVMRY